MDSSGEERARRRRRIKNWIAFALLLGLLLLLFLPGMFHRGPD